MNKGEYLSNGTRNTHDPSEIFSSFNFFFIESIFKRCVRTVFLIYTRYTHTQSPPFIHFDSHTKNLYYYKKNLWKKLKLDKNGNKISAWKKWKNMENIWVCVLMGFGWVLRNEIQGKGVIFFVNKWKIRLCSCSKPDTFIHYEWMIYAEKIFFYTLILWLRNGKPSRVKWWINVCTSDWMIGKTSDSTKNYTKRRKYNFLRIGMTKKLLPV